MFAVSATRTNQGAARIIAERMRKQRLEREEEMKRREEAELEAKRREMERRDAIRAKQDVLFEKVIGCYREVEVTGEVKLSVKDIAQAAIVDSGLSLDDVLGPRRTRHLANYRHYAILCVWALRPDMSLPNIGKHLGGRDHTTIYHAIGRFGFESRSEAARFIKHHGRDATMARLRK